MSGPNPTARPAKSLPYQAELRLEGDAERWTVTERYVLRATDESPEATMVSLSRVPGGWTEEAILDGAQVIAATWILQVPPTSFVHAPSTHRGDIWRSEASGRKGLCPARALDQPMSAWG